MAVHCVEVEQIEHFVHEIRVLENHLGGSEFNDAVCGRYANQSPKPIHPPLPGPFAGQFR